MKELNETKVLKLVMADARKVLQTDQLEVVTMQPTTWPDSALGLAELGFSYLQVLTSGTIIKIRSRDTELVYHTDTIGNFKQVHYQER